MSCWVGAQGHVNVAKTMLKNSVLSDYRPFLRGCNNPRLPPTKGPTCASLSQHLRPIVITNAFSKFTTCVSRMVNPCSYFMDRLIHIAGYDWETDWYKRRELYSGLMNAVPDHLHWTLAGHCDTDVVDLATLADNILLDSKNRRNQRSDHSSNFSSSAFSSTHSQSPRNICKQTLTALQAQMNEMQTSVSRVAANTSKPCRYSKNQQNSSDTSSRGKNQIPSTNSSAQKQPLDTPDNPKWCFYHNRFKTNARKCKDSCSYAKDTQSNVQQVSPASTKQVSADPFRDSYNQDRCYYHNQFGGRARNCKIPCSYIANIDYPDSFRNFLRIVSAIRYSGQETNFPIAFLCLTMVLMCLCYLQHLISSSVQERVIANGYTTFRSD